MLRSRCKGPLAGRLAKPPVHQTRLALLRMALTPTPERPLASPSSSAASTWLNSAAS
ncbi:MAG: hypothetical protein ACREDV_11870 [Methylocella sp.]